MESVILAYFIQLQFDFFCSFFCFFFDLFLLDLYRENMFLALLFNFLMLPKKMKLI